MIEPKDIEIDGKVFVLSKFNYEDGREIITQYPMSAIPKLGDYPRNKEIVRLMMKYVGVYLEPGRVQALITPELMNNHLGSWERGMSVEWAMMEYNCSFFRDGRISTFLDEFAQNIPQWITKISTLLSGLSSEKEKQPSMN